MKTLILVAVILQLVITTSAAGGNDGAKKTELKPGDILEFPRTCGTESKIYSHFGVYVGPKSGIDVGQGDNDMFHRTGKDCTHSVCQFGKIEDVKGSGEVKKNNYLDKPAGLEPTFYESPEFLKDFAERIKAAQGTCETYRPLKNNCEHAATKMRYDQKHSKQAGTLAEPVLKMVEATKEGKVILESVLQHVKIEMDCPFSDP